MKKIILITLAFIMAAGFAWARLDSASFTPEVRYLSPKDENVVDLTGKESLLFSWKPVPIPGGGRLCYKFELFKGYGYDRIVNETLSHDNVAMVVPADMFENGSIYTWQVTQRDEMTRNWSRASRWVFKVKK